VGIGVGERAETVVILLASRIPKSQLDVLSIDLNIGHIVLEDGWDVDLSSHIISLAGIPRMWQIMPLCICSRSVRVCDSDESMMGRVVRWVTGGVSVEAYLWESALGENT
jgi:hypothetical protein